MHGLYGFKSQQSSIKQQKQIALVTVKLYYNAFRCLMDKKHLKMDIDVGYGQRGSDGNVLMQQIYRIGEWSPGQRAAGHWAPATIKNHNLPPFEKCWCKRKKMWMQMKRKGCSRSLSDPPSLSSLSYLRLQASRPLQQRPWSTTPPAWSSHIPPDYSIESRKNVTNPADGRKEKDQKTRTAEMMAKLERESAKHLMMSVLSSLPLSYLSLSLSAPANAAVEN